MTSVMKKVIIYYYMQTKSFAANLNFCLIPKECIRLNSSFILRAL